MCTSNAIHVVGIQIAQVKLEPGTSNHAFKNLTLFGLRKCKHGAFCQWIHLSSWPESALPVDEHVRNGH